MNPTASIPDKNSRDPLLRYATTVHGLHEKLGPVRANPREIADNLSRAVVALHSLSAHEKRP